MLKNSITKAVTAWETKHGCCFVVKSNGKRKLEYVNYTEWYFFILKADYEKATPIIKEYLRLGVIGGVQVGNTYVKIISHRPTRDEYTVDMLRLELENIGVDAFEFDLPKWKRYMIDNNIQIEDDYSILYFDIETDDSTGEIAVGRDRIISWAAKDSKGKEFYAQGPEAEILAKFVKLIEKYDIITGWNSEQFDLPYIIARTEHHGITYNWKSIIHIDMLQRCFKIYSYEAPIIGLRSFSLNEVSKTFLGLEKVEVGMKIHELEKTNPELLKEYNKWDVELLYQLDTKLSILPLMIQECVWTCSFLNKFYIGELLDNYILREAKQRKIILASKPSAVRHHSLEDMKITGGYVMTPKQGYYQDVHVCDFKSLYPSIIVGWNIGKDALDVELSERGQVQLVAFLNGRTIEHVDFDEWDTFLRKQKTELDPEDKYIQTANNAFFSKTKNSFIGDLVEKLLAERQEYKKKLKVLDFDTKEYNNTYAAERVVKEMANSMFGITCDKNSRYFDKLVSEGITYTGQYLNKLSTHIADELGMTTIYGDTDSVFIVGGDMSKMIDEINQKMKDRLDTEFGLRNNIVKLEYEKMFSHFILLEKKRYTGRLSMKDGKPFNKAFSRGTEDVKKSYIVYGKQKFKEIVDKVFSGMTCGEAEQYIMDLRDKVLSKDVDISQLVLTTKVSQDPSKYKTKQMHVRLAERLIAQHQLLPITESNKRMGTRLEYLVTKVDKKQEAILVSEYDDNIDWSYYWEKQIYPPLRRVLDIVFPHVDWPVYIKKDEHEQLSLF